MRRVSVAVAPKCTAACVAMPCPASQISLPLTHGPLTRPSAIPSCATCRAVNQMPPAQMLRAGPRLLDLFYFLLIGSITDIECICIDAITGSFMPASSPAIEALQSAQQRGPYGAEGQLEIWGMSSVLEAYRLAIACAQMSQVEGTALQVQLPAQPGLPSMFVLACLCCQCADDGAYTPSLLPLAAAAPAHLPASQGCGPPRRRRLRCAGRDSRFRLGPLQASGWPLACTLTGLPRPEKNRQQF